MQPAFSEPELVGASVDLFGPEHDDIAALRTAPGALVHVTGVLQHEQWVRDVIK